MTCNLVVGSHWCVDTSSYLSWKEVTPRIKPDLLGFSWIWGPMKRRSVWAWICSLKVGPKGCTRCNYCPQIKTLIFFLEVSGRYLEGTHWVYGKKTMWRKQWNVCTCEHLVVRDALLAFMLCKFIFKYMRKKFQRCLYWWTMDRKYFFIVFLSLSYHFGLYSPSECMYYVPTFVASKRPTYGSMLLTHLHR
jgi:hypothetical protein